MTLLRSFAMLGAAVMPLVGLTAMAFLGGGGRTDATSYEPAELTELEAVGTATGGELAKLPEAGGLAEDPAGFSSEGEPSDSLTLPYAVAQQLVEGERALDSNDIDLVRRTKKSLEQFGADNLTAIAKLRPRGDGLGEAIKSRIQSADRHEAWLSKRAVVRETLANAAAAMAEGPEIDGERKCLELLRDLQKNLPAVADPDSIKDEPVDMMTPGEAEAVAQLQARAKFRGKFLTARRNTATKSEKASELKAELDAWDEFLKLYAKSGAPDPRDAAFLADARQLRRKAELDWRWALALNQSSAGGLVSKVADWLRVVRSDKGDENEHGQAAAGLVRTWLENNVPAVPRKPKGLEGLQEGFTDPANKRKLGFFKKVALTEKQYYFWTDKTLMKTKGKGEEQFNLRNPPSEPEYLAVIAAYEACRKAFLAEGHRAAEGTMRFRDECRRLAEKYAEHRKAYEEPDNPIDADAKGWGEAFGRAEKIAAELADAGNKSDVWELLATPSGP
jgi:hypothetical protein